MEIYGEVKITNPDCTRFWMTREEAAKLVVDTLTTMKGGGLVIPDLPAFRLGDLACAMGMSADDMEVVGLPDYEKEHESMSGLVCSATSRRLTVADLRERLAKIV
jgi:FlaA1/EpsC-like NDP-sugar epimerase